METSDFLSQAPPDRILFVCWLPRADLLDLRDGDHLQISRVDDLCSSRRQPLADLVRPREEDLASSSGTQSHGSPHEVPITLAGLASSEDHCWGRSSAVIPNDKDHGGGCLKATITVGESPIAGSAIYLHWIPVGVDGYDGTDRAHFMQRRSLPLGALICTSSQPGLTYHGTFSFPLSDTNGGLVVTHNTGCALDPRPEKHAISLVGISP